MLMQQALLVTESNGILEHWLGILKKKKLFRGLKTWAMTPSTPSPWSGGNYQPSAWWGFGGRVGSGEPSSVPWASPPWEPPPSLPASPGGAPLPARHAGYLQQSGKWARGWGDYGCSIPLTGIDKLINVLYSSKIDYNWIVLLSWCSLFSTSSSSSFCLILLVIASTFWS